MEKHSLIRTIYLYLFALIGLALLTSGGVRLLDMGLKALIFTKAEDEERLYQKQPPYMPFSSVERAKKLSEEDKTELSVEERANIQQWLNDYKNWQEQRAKIDPVTARRHRDAASILATILIGFPLYFYHWRVIKKETKHKGE